MICDQSDNWPNWSGVANVQCTVFVSLKIPVSDDASSLNSFQLFAKHRAGLDLKRRDARLWLTSASVSPDRDLMNDPYLPTWPRPVPALEALEGPSQPARLSSSTVSRGARFGPRHRSASEAAGLSAGQQHLGGFLADGTAGEAAPCQTGCWRDKPPPQCLPQDRTHVWHTRKI